MVQNILFFFFFSFFFSIFDEISHPENMGGGVCWLLGHGNSNFCSHELPSKNITHPRADAPSPSPSIEFTHNSLYF